MFVNFSRPSAKLIQSQQSTQLESSEHSDSSDELPPTPPNQLLWSAVREVSTARGVTSPTATVTNPTARGVTSPTCEAMFTKILTILEEVKETQSVHGKMLNALLKKQDGSMVEVPEGVILPLKTQADLEALDQKLGDRSVMSAVVSLYYLLHLRSKTPKAYNFIVIGELLWFILLFLFY